MTSFEEVMQLAGEIIMDMSGVFITIPNMRNGRCFVSSKVLSEATLEQVKSHMLVRRNATGVPIMERGTIDKARHDFGLGVEVGSGGSRDHHCRARRRSRFV